MTKATEGYLMGRDRTASARLTAQHHVLLTRQGWHLHPSVEPHIKGLKHPRIADVATGNGIWAVEVSELIPEAEIVALDISSDQFPPESTRPANLKFDHYDVLKQPPAEYAEKFDLVHVRFLVAPGPRVPPATFLENFRALLKPGGWLQMEELAYPYFKEVDPKTYRAHEQFHPAMSLYDRHTNTSQATAWLAQLHQHLEQNGFTKAIAEVPAVKARQLKYETDLMAGSIIEHADGIIRARKLEGEARRQCEKMKEDVIQCISDGALLCYHYYVGAGQKPAS